MAFSLFAWGRAGLAVAIVFALLALVYQPAFSVERPHLDSYRSDVARVKAFLRHHLASEYSLGGPNTDKLIEWIVEYSLENDTDPILQTARILKESRGRHYKLNSRGEKTVLRGRSREIGFSQIHPFWIGKTVSNVKITKEMLFDPEGNVKVGIVIYKRYDYGDYLAALTHYNNPRANSPNGYAKDVNRLYMHMLAKYSVFSFDPEPVEDAVGSAILIGRVST
ncbi:transglycosylase SLT domain-containing protein [bacterium]|nr:transglycosylase SLT domain-containing protein [bacterium]